MNCCLALTFAGIETIIRLNCSGLSLLTVGVDNLDAYSFFAQNFILPLLAGAVLFIIGTKLRWPWKTRIVACLIAFLIAFGVSLLVTGKREKHQLAGVITDGRTHTPIAQVNVSLVGGLALHEDVTDAKGYFHLELVNSVKDGDSVRLKVTKGRICNLRRDRGGPFRSSACANHVGTGPR